MGRPGWDPPPHPVSCPLGLVSCLTPVLSESWVSAQRGVQAGVPTLLLVTETMVAMTEELQPQGLQPQEEDAGLTGTNRVLKAD